MLLDLYIKDFTLVDDLHVRFGPGLNVLTGETGAGKSLIVDAISLVLGGRGSPELIRYGVDETRLEAVFSLGRLPHAAAAAREEGLIDGGDDTLIVSREINRGGRNACRVNGRPVTVATLRRLTDGLADIQGQHEFQRLFNAEHHLALLDAYGGKHLSPLLEKAGELAGAVRLLAADKRRLLADQRERRDRLGLLRYQVDEIDGVAPRPGEDEELTIRRGVLANAGRLLAAAGEAYVALHEGDEGLAPVLAELARVSAQIQQCAALDPALNAIAECLRALVIQTGETCRDLRRYRDGLEFDPLELAKVEERLVALNDLKRKYGPTVDEVLARRQAAAAELQGLSALEEDAGRVDERLEALRHELATAAGGLSELRAQVAAEMASRVESELTGLGMGGSRFRAVFSRLEEPEAHGWDRVEFHFSANPGEPPQPLARVASGGEASRCMLAIKAVLAESEPAATLVLDEVDAGLGGRAARAVAERLRDVSRRYQTLCVTHLAAVAVVADRHFTVEKVGDGDRTVIRVRPLSDDARVEEVARMLSGEGGAASREHARDLLSRAHGKPA